MFQQTFNNLDNVLRQEAGCTTELDYTEQSSWMLFLKYLDDLEQERALQAELVNKSYEFIIDEAHRLTTGALGRFLTLLEPIPEHVVFCFTTTRVGRRSGKKV